MAKTKIDVFGSCVVREYMFNLEMQSNINCVQLLLGSQFHHYSQNQLKKIQIG